MDKLDIEFKAIQEYDLEMIMNWRMRPDITKYMNTDVQLTLEDQYKWYQYIRQQKDEYYWVICVDGEKVGVISLTNPGKVVGHLHTGMYVAVKTKRSLRLTLDLQWNLYRYAFDCLNCHKVCEYVFTLNETVNWILDLCGSKVEGKLRDHVYKNGTYFDVTVRGILKNEWDDMKDNLKFNKAKIEEYH